MVASCSSHFAVLFEELVEQHRVHRFVAHGVRLALLVAGHQIGIHLFHVLSHEAELRDALGVKLVLVAEGHRFERENRFARFVHRFDLVLETRRGSDRAELTVGIDDYSYASGNGGATNAGDKGARREFLASPMRIVLDSPASATIADIDVVTARGEIDDRLQSPNAMLLLPVVLLRSALSPMAVLLLPVVLLGARKTDGRVVVAGCVDIERISTGGRVGVAGCVVGERTETVAVLPMPVVLLKSALTPMAVLSMPVVLLKSALKPMAVLSRPVVLFKSASSPRTVLSFVKQPSWQTARACGESAKQPSVSAMRTGRIVVFLD